MADVTDANTNAEPSMEEILASIRRIIADEKDPNAAAAAVPDPSEDVIELTQVVQPDGSVQDLETKEPEVAIEIPPAPAPMAMPDPMPAPKMDEGLVSSVTAQTATSALETLAHTVEIERRISPATFTPIGNGSRSLEDMVLELLKPMLKGWLDENLTPIVERIVQKEVERIARRVQE